MQKLKILHITEAALGGVRTHLRLLITEQLRLGHEVYLIVSLQRSEEDVEDELEELRGKGCKVFVVSMQRNISPLSDFKALLAIRKIARVCVADVVHSHATKAGLLARLAVFGLGGKVVYSPHAFIINYYNSGIKRFVIVALERFLSFFTDGYLLISSSEREQAICEYGLSAKKLFVAENGLLPADGVGYVSRLESRRRLGIDSGVFAICIIGRLVAQKGHGWLLEALALMKGNGYELHIFGAGDLRAELEELVARLFLGDRVFFHGVQADLQQYLQAFDLAVVPSLYEGLSYALLELFQAGVPVVCSDISANFPDKDLKKYLFAVALNDKKGLAKVLDKVLKDKKMVAKMGNGLKVFMESHFKLDEQVSGILQCYLQLLK